MELLKLLSTNEIIAQIASFLLLFIILKAFAWKRVLRILDQRRERISAEFKNIEDSKAGVAALKSEYEKSISSIEEIAKEKIGQALASAQAQASEIKGQARADAQSIIDDAKKNIRYELNKAREELKEKIIDISLRAAEEVIEQKLTEEKDREIVEEFLEKVDQVK